MLYSTLRSVLHFVENAETTIPGGRNIGYNEEDDEIHMVNKTILCIN